MEIKQSQPSFKVKKNSTLKLCTFSSTASFCFFLALDLEKVASFPCGYTLLLQVCALELSNLIHQALLTLHEKYQFSG